MTGVGFAASTTHSHPVCGSRCTCASSSHGNVTWTAWDGTTKMYGGYYYLTKDVVLSSTIILDYSYTTYLCLNGHSITCADRVFDIYSYRSLIITDCKGTGKIESTDGFSTIINNKSLRIWGGTILNSSDGIAIYTCSGTYTYIHGGTVESTEDCAIYSQPDSQIQIYGGTVHGYYYAITSHDTASSAGTGRVTVSGGTLSSSDPYNEAVNIQNGCFTMTGGCIDSVQIFNERGNGTTTISGGTIGSLLIWDGPFLISGGNIGSFSGFDGTITGGTFQGSCNLMGSVTISGGDFTGCFDDWIQGVEITGEDVWICGGSFDKITLPQISALYLSGTPTIRSLEIDDDAEVIAQNPDGTGSYGGNAIEVELPPYNPYGGSSEWKDGDVVIKNVRSDTVAKKFTLTGYGSTWRYLERSGNNLVLRELPHGEWGNNVNWRLDNDTLIISGSGVIKETYSGTEYPWGDYVDQIKKIIVEPGITGIPRYTFEYCENAQTIILPETLTSLVLNAFNDCGSLNNLLLPSSITSITGTSNTGFPTFIRCESLSDVYYLGTAEEWDAATNDAVILSSDSNMTLHYLQPRGAAPTCTEAGTQTYYQFDNTSVYGDMYDENKNVISQPQTIPASGHTIINTPGKPATCTEIGWNAYSTCAVCDYTTYQEIPALGHDLITHPAQAETCDNPGWKEYKTCSRCDYTTYEEIPPHETVIETVPRVEPTCSATGLTAGTRCKLCGKIISAQQEIAKLPHSTVTHAAQAPTCTQPGWNAYVTCKNCDYSTYAELPALGHNLTSHAAKAATCTAIGWNAYVTCSHCDYSTYEAIPMQPHTVVIDAAVPATAAANGLTEGSHCSVCGTVLQAQQTTDIVESGACGANVTYTLNRYGLLTVSGTGAMYNYNDSSSLSPFYHRADVKKVIVENGVTGVGNYAFYGCTDLTEITIPDSVKNIGQYAFSGCTGLTALILPDSVVSIGSGAFYNCSGMTDLTLPDGITAIAGNVFYNCQSLTGLTIPDGVTSIAPYSFFNCAGLTELVLPDGVASISQFAFSGCTGLTSITVPLSLINISNNVFNGCTGLATVRYEGLSADWSAVSIGNNNSFLAAADFEWHCKTDHTPGARQETVLTAAGCETAGEKRVVISCALCGKTYVDENVSIAPLGHNYINHAKRAATCTQAGWEAYQTCSRCDYTTYTAIPMLPHSTVQHAAQAPTCTQPGWNAYVTCENCDYTTKTELPALGHNLTSHAAKAATCTAIGWNAYVTCSRCDYSTYAVTPIQPHTVVIDAAVPGTPTAAGLTEGSHCSVCGAVLQAQEATDIVASGACGTNVTYTLDRFGLLTISGTGAMYNYNDSSSVSPFHELTGVKKVVIEGGVTGVGNYAFYGCTDLTEITIPDSVKNIGQYAFSGCTGLTALILPDSVVSIGSGAFYNCSGMTDLTLPDGITAIAGNVFYNCQSLTGLTIPDGVTSIAPYSFFNCAGLTELVLPDGVASISQFAFSGCTGLTSITVPLSLINISNNVFNGCTGLATVRYEGLSADWSAVSIGNNNGSLTAADFEWHCKLPHQYVAAATVTPATMDADGSGTLTCSLCGTTIQGTIPRIAAVTLSADTFVYTGAAQRPDVTITDADGAVLTEGEDYTLTLSGDSTAAGAYTLTVTFTGKYAGTAEKTYTIAAQPLATSCITYSPHTFYTNGKQQQPTVTVTNEAGKTLVEGTDYTVTYPESIEPGSYLVKIDGINGYKGTVRKRYIIKEVEALDSSRISYTPITFYANGEQQQPTVTVTNEAGKTLVEGTDYTVTYPESIEPGSYLVKIDGINGYKGTVRKRYIIKEVEALDSSRISYTPITFYANGEQQQPTVTVTNAAGKTLKEGTDYTVTYPESIEPGSYLVKIDGINGYKGTVRKRYIIKEVEALDSSRISYTPITFYANGEQQQPTVTVTNAAGKTLKKGTDYTVTYPESIEPGSYLVKIDGINGYKGTVRKRYIIKPAREVLDAANVTRTPISFVANGAQQQPTVTVKNAAGKTLVEGTDYTVTYPESIEPGSYIVRVDGINGYSGSIRKVYIIK